MKRTVTLISCLILGIAVSLAQSLAESLKGSDLLSEVFVNPLGIHDLTADADPSVVEDKIKASGVVYSSASLGPLGEMFRLTPTDLKIGGVPIAGAAVSVNGDAVMLLYQSEPADNYKDMPEALDKALRNYAKDITQSGSGDNAFNVYMLNDRYGIAVGSDDARQTSLAILLDIRNLQGFLGLGSLLPN